MPFIINVNQIRVVVIVAQVCIPKFVYYFLLNVLRVVAIGGIM